MRIKTKYVTGPINQVFNDTLGIYYPSFEEEKERIKTFQELALRRKEMKYAFTSLQTHLFQSMIIEQQFLKTIKENPISNIPEEVQETILGTSRFPLNAMRNIANGMAFRFMDYNMPLMQKVGSQNNGVDELASEGVFHESELFSHISDITPPGTQVFMCSLCDLVGIGDIIIKTEDSFEFIEVKKGKKRGKRITRQKERLKSLEDFFNTEEETVEGHKVQLVCLPCRNTHCNKLEDAINECLVDNISKFQVSDYQIVYCFDTKQNQNLLREQIDNAYRDVEKAFGNRFHAFLSSKYMNSTGLNVPFSVFPISPDNVAELLLGGVAFISFLSFDAIENHIWDKGWEFKNCIENRTADKLFTFPIYICFDPKDLDHNYSIPVDYLLDCSINFIDLDCLLDNSIYIASNYSGCFTPYYEDEKRIWL